MSQSIHGPRIRQKSGLRFILAWAGVACYGILLEHGQALDFVSESTDDCGFCLSLLGLAVPFLSPRPGRKTFKISNRPSVPSTLLVTLCVCRFICGLGAPWRASFRPNSSEMMSSFSQASQRSTVRAQKTPSPCGGAAEVCFTLN